MTTNLDLAAHNRANANTIETAIANTHDDWTKDNTNVTDRLQVSPYGQFLYQRIREASPMLAGAIATQFPWIEEADRVWCENGDPDNVTPVNGRVWSPLNYLRDEIHGLRYRADLIDEAVETCTTGVHGPPTDRPTKRRPVDACPACDAPDHRLACLHDEIDLRDEAA